MEKKLTEILNLVKHKNISPEEAYQLIFTSGGINGTNQNKPMEIDASYANKNITQKDGVKQFLREIISRETKLPKEKIQDNTTFDFYGLDSFMITRLNKKLEELFGNLPKTLFFEYRTLSELSEYFIENMGEKLLEIIGLRQDEIPINNSGKPDMDAMERLISNANETVYEENSDVFNSKEIHVKNQPIAIIGLAGRYPMAQDLSAFWENLKAGKDCIIEIPEERWDYNKYFTSNKNETGKSYSKWGAFLKDVDKFDPLFFNISPREAELMDPQERLFLETAWQVIEDAGYTRQTLGSVSVGVYVGVMYGEYQLLGLEEQLKGSQYSVWQFYSSIANRVSFILNLSGPSMSVDTMCSSSLTSIHLACQSIKNGDCDMAIAGGVNLSLHPNKYIMLSQNKFLSSEGKCRSFGEGGDGYVPGEGVGAVLLKPLDRAVEDGDYIYGIIKGTSLNHGGKTNGFTVPNPNAHSNLISKAIEVSGVDPRTISYMEAHGTGTSLGDPIEIAGLSRAFSKYCKDKQFCPIGSVKSNIGHLESAAGIAGITKVLLQMKYKKLVPSILSEKINSNLSFEDSPFYIQREYEDWISPGITVNDRNESYPKRAGISSFGAGGSNAHVILEEYDSTKINGALGLERALFVLSAKSEQELLEYAGKIAGFIDKNKELDIHSVCYTLQTGREPMEERIAFTVLSMDDIKEKLTGFITGKSASYALLYRSGSSELKHGTPLDFSREKLEDALLNRNLDFLACYWVSGYEVDFRGLYCAIPAKVPLPTYPFQRKSYWLPKGNKSTDYGENFSTIHPLVHQNASTVSTYRTLSRFTGDEFFIRDHVINGQRLLPGAAYLEIAKIASEIITDERTGLLQNVFWVRPMVFNGYSINVETRILPEENGIGFQVYSCFEDGYVLNSHGNVLLKSTFANEKLDLDVLVNRMSNFGEKDEIYRSFKDSGFEYGPAFRVIEELYKGPSEVLSVMRLPSENRANINQFFMHPAMLDGALQSTLALLIENTSGAASGYLPFSIREMEMIRPVPETAYVYVHEGQTNEREPYRKMNLKIMDEEGYVLIDIKDFILQKVQGISGGLEVKHGETGISELKILLSGLYEGRFSKDYVAGKLGRK